MADNIPKRAPELQRPEFDSMVHMLAHAAKEHPDHTAVISGENEITFADYYACVAGLAENLIAMGAKGERVIVLKANSIETAVAANAVWAAGAQVVMFNPLYTENELRPLVEDVSPKVILCDSVHVEVLAPLAEANGVTHFYTFEDERVAIDQWRGKRELRLPEPFPKSTDLALLAYTGGTTGLPKGAIHTHAMMLAMAKSMDGLYSTSIAGDIWLNVAPVSHIWGWCVSLVAPMYGCNTIVLVPKFIPDVVISEIARTKATVFAGGPSVIYNALLAVPTLRETDLSQLRLCLGGGSAFADATIAAWQDATDNTVHELWGMSEAAPLSGNPSDRPNKIGSVGLPCVATDVEAVDPETGVDVMPVDEAGELRVRGPQMITSYWNRPDETASAIRDGWLYTGDIGSIDELGRITIVDRKKDMVNVGGYNVFPREIDEVLFAHPEIQEAAAIGVPDSHRGEAVQAYVVKTEGATVSAEEIIDYCKESLAKFKVPTEVHIVDSLPKTPAAKIDKMALRKSFEGN
ncbi:MAG: AMP-binding protein [Rhodospirillaceae bacterium]|jgi:long-chain acyl-CoA synthetase|nr:AMP-binding protein [Rhodospirillaceae bacterium]MBT4589696.1 AMP-binding protein [Rhodospirillaceae bacterium]MBT5939063.1 AMP-binding protein [Rhodospirillaceae bacterium]MBT7268062.1 AMP-binding protein [Rhodospirillaceae bacterium]